MADGRLRFSGVMQWGRWHLDFTGRTLVMGVLNVTPDSFSDGGRFVDPARAVDHALAMAAAGADVIDVNVGGHPGHEPDIMRWAVEAIQEAVDLPLAIDSSYPETVRAGLEV